MMRKGVAASIVIVLAALMLFTQACSALLLPPEPPRPPQQSFEVRVDAEGVAFRFLGGLRKPAFFSLTGVVESVKSPLDAKIPVDPLVQMRGRGKATVRIEGAVYVLDVYIQVSRWWIRIHGESGNISLNLNGWVSGDSLTLFGNLVFYRFGKPIIIPFNQYVPEIWILNLKGKIVLTPIIRPL